MGILNDPPIPGAQTAPMLVQMNRYYLTLNKVDCQKASMMSAHRCGDLVYNHTPERSPTATVAKRAYHHHHHPYNHGRGGSVFPSCPAR